MNDASRRQFLQTASVAVAGAMLAGTSLAAEQTAIAGGPVLANPAFLPQHEPRPLPFDPAKLHGISEKLIRSHWENNYGGSVTALNTVKQKLARVLADKDTPPYIYDDLKREHLMRTGSVVFHELYFENLGGDGQVDDASRRALTGAFGSYAAWEAEFRKIGAGLGGGSGWVILGYNLHTGQIENYWLWDHLHGPAATWPLLVMDMYEHSYQLDYGAAAPKYVEAFFQNIRWSVVASRLASAQRFIEADKTA